MGHSLRGFSNHEILQAKIVAEVFPTERSNPHLFHVLNWETVSFPPGKPIYKVDMLWYLTVFPFLIVSWLPSLVFSKMRCTCKIINWNVWIGYYSFNLCILFHLLKFSIFSSVEFSRSVVSDSLRPHESQHARPPCPSPTPRVHSDSRPSSQWYHPAISSSVIPFSTCPQSLPASVFSNESTLRMR